MTDVSPASSSIIRCHGMIIDHRNRWWFVEFSKPGGNPTSARLLSGEISTGLADNLGFDTGPRILLPSVAALNPENSCWMATVDLISSMPSSKPEHVDFHVDAHALAGEAGELEVRLARAMIETKLFPIPSEFTSVFDGLPNENEPVLAIRLSGYTCSTFELLTARHMPTYRPRSPWRDISSESVFDSGSDILGWMPSRDWIKPR